MLKMLIIFLSLMASDRSELPHINELDDNAVGVSYHKFVLFRTLGDTYAIHILPHPKYGEDGITYTWYRLPGGGHNFFDPKVEVGQGETKEVNGMGRVEMGSIKTGPFSIDWSKGNKDLGWLYWCDAPKDIAVYRYQWTRLEDIKQLNDASWLSCSSIKESKGGILERTKKTLRILLSDQAAEVNPEQAKAIGEIEKLGGRVIIDEKSPDKPVIGVDLVRSQVTDDGLEHLKGLTKLQRLYLGSDITVAGLEHLKGLTQLKELYLDGTEMTDVELKHLKGLTQLRGLHFYRTFLTNAGLEHIKIFTQLQRLEILFTDVTDAGMEHLKELSQLKELYVSDSKITNAGLECLKGMTQLQVLNLTNIKVTDAGLEHLKGLTDLQSLRLAGIRVTDAGLEHLKGLTKLQRLELPGIKITDAGLEHLKGLTQLRELYLPGADITDTGLEHLKGLTTTSKIEPQ